MNHLAGGEMLGKRLGVAVVIVLTMLVASAVAQDEKNELGGVLGRTFISNQGITGGTDPGTIIAFGKGLSFEFQYPRQLRTRRTSWAASLGARSSATRGLLAGRTRGPSSPSAKV